MPLTASATRPGSLLWSVYEHVAMVLGLSSLAVVCLTWTPLAIALYPVLPTPLGRWLGRQAIMRGFRIYVGILRTLCACRFDLGALDALRDQGPMVIAANHPSLLDAVLIISRLPNVICVMKASLMDNLLFGAAARLARYIRNDSPRGMIRLAVQDLQHGGQLVLFPEGTRTTRHPINAFRPGVTLIAKLARAPIQTVFIDTESPYLGKGWPIWKLPPLPIRFSVRLGERFAPQDDTDALLAQLEAYFAAGVKPSGPTA